MDRPFDPTLKTLAELSPADWLPILKRRRVTVEDSDVGTIVSGATDKLFRVPTIWRAVIPFLACLFSRRLDDVPYRPAFPCARAAPASDRSATERGRKRPGDRQ